MARKKAAQEGVPSKKITTGEIFRDFEGNKVTVLKVDKNSASIPVTFRTEQGEGKLPMEEFKKQFSEKLTFVQGQEVVSKKTGEVYTLNTDVLANVTRGKIILIRDVKTGLLSSVPQIELIRDFVAVKNTAEVVAPAEPEQAAEPVADTEPEEPAGRNDAGEIPEPDTVEPQPEPAPVTPSNPSVSSQPAPPAGAAFTMAGAVTVAAATTYPTQAMRPMSASAIPQPEQQPVTKSPEAVLVQDPATPEAPATEQKDVAFEQLKALLEEKRQEYVEDDYRHDSSVSRLAKILGIVHIEKTPTYKEEYEAALRAVEDYERKQLEAKLQDIVIPDAEKAKLVQSHFLRFSFEEKIVLYELGLGVKMKAESDKWYTKAGELVMQFGNGYRHLNWKQKAAIAAGVIGVGALAGATGGAAAIAVAGALGGARRAVVGTASFLAANEGTNKLVDWMGERGAKKEVEQLMKKEADPTYAALFAQLDTKISSLDKALEDRKRWGNRAKVMGIVSAVGLSGVTHLTHFFGFEDSVPAGASAEHVSGAAASAGEQGMNQDAIPRGAVDAVPGSGAASAATERLGSVTDTIDTAGTVKTPIFGEVDVAPADRARGLWGILDRQLPPDMPEAERNQVIARLEALAKTKFAGKSPVEIQALYGFGSGNLDVIRDEDVLKLQALFSQEEYAAALEGKGSVVSSTISTADQAVQGSMATDGAAAAARQVVDVAHTAVGATKEASVALVQDSLQGASSASLKAGLDASGDATMRSASFTPHPIDQMQGNYVSADQGDVYRGNRELLQDRVARGGFDDVATETKQVVGAAGNYTLEQSNPTKLAAEFPNQDVKSFLTAGKLEIGKQLFDIDTTEFGKNHVFSKSSIGELQATYNSRPMAWMLEKQGNGTYMSAGIDRRSIGIFDQGYHFDRPNIPNIGPDLNDGPDPRAGRFAIDMHTGYMERFAAMTNAAVHEFGEAGKPTSTETSGQYLVRIGTLVARKKIEDRNYSFHF